MHDNKMPHLQRAMDSLRAHLSKNEGLLLIMASEGFFALMNVAVKLLGTDVSVLEVSSSAPSLAVLQTTDDRRLCGFEW